MDRNRRLVCVGIRTQDAKALTIAGHVRAFLHHRLREAIALHERALMLNSGSISSSRARTDSASDLAPRWPSAAR